MVRMGELLRIKGLRTYFATATGLVKAVDGVNIDVRTGETVGLVGESGSGKTVTALSVLRVVPRPGKIIDGQIIFEGEDLLQKSERQMEEYRGRKLAIVFQDPASSLNPVFTIGNQLTEIITHHQKLSRDESKSKAVRLLERVRIPDPQIKFKEYPHQFSGGMKQRLCIAKALACDPTLLFADEPTSNLDVTIQAQILDLLRELKRELDMSLVMITHDLGIVAEMTDRSVVLYAGRVCEIAPTTELFERHKHPYTEGLLAAIPRTDVKKPLEVIPGNLPNLVDPPQGCRFHPRCKYAKPICTEYVPIVEETSPEHYVACHRWKEIAIT